MPFPCLAASSARVPVRARLRPISTGSSPETPITVWVAASEWFLINKGGVQVQASDLSFEQAISMSCINQSAYIRSLPLWPLRAPYWFFIRRRTYHGKTVEQLQREGKIILPNDPRFKPFQTRI